MPRRPRRNHRPPSSASCRPRGGEGRADDDRDRRALRRAPQRDHEVEAPAARGAPAVFGASEHDRQQAEQGRAARQDRRARPDDGDRRGPHRAAVSRRKKDQGRVIAQGPAVGRGHVATLMRRMGIAAIAPQAPALKAGPGPQDLPLPSAGPQHHRGGARLVVRRNLSAHGQGLLLPRRDHGLRRAARRSPWASFPQYTLDAAFCIEALAEALESLQRAAGLNPTRAQSHR